MIHSKARSSGRRSCRMSMGAVVGGGASIVRPDKEFALMNCTTVSNLDNGAGMGTGKGIGID
jgi:hypothetical protein